MEKADGSDEEAWEEEAADEEMEMGDWSARVLMGRPEPAHGTEARASRLEAWGRSICHREPQGRLQAREIASERAPGSLALGHPRCESTAAAYGDVRCAMRDARIEAVCL